MSKLDNTEYSADSSRSCRMAMSQRAFTSSRTALGPVRVSRTASLSVFARESRIGARPITIPKGVTITLDGSTLKVKAR